MTPRTLVRPMVSPLTNIPPRRTREEAIDDLESLILSEREREDSLAWVQEWQIFSIEDGDICHAESTGRHEDYNL